MIIKELISNAAILISFLFVSAQVFKDKPISASISNKLLIGFFGGVFGTFLMLFSIDIDDSTILDLRHFAISIVTIYGGFISSIFAAFIIAISRIAIWGINFSSISAIIVIILFALSSTFVSRLNFSTKNKLLLMTSINTLIVFVAFYILLDDWELLREIYISYFIINIVSWYLISKLIAYIVSSTRNYRKLKEDSRRDFLTGVSNVRHFDLTINHYFESTKQKENDLSLLFMDIDYFKLVNDTYGHDAGDFVLKEISKKLISFTRNVDTVSRIGGEEFSVILPNSSHNQATVIAERIRKGIEEHSFIYSNQTIRVTVSIGVSSYPETIDNPEYLKKQADDFLYLAKNTGRNSVYSSKNTFNV